MMKIETMRKHIENAGLQSTDDGETYRLSIESPHREVWAIVELRARFRRVPVEDPGSHPWYLVTDIRVQHLDKLNSVDALEIAMLLDTAASKLAPIEAVSAGQRWTDNEVL